MKYTNSLQEARDCLLEALLVVREEALLLSEVNEGLTSHISSEYGICSAVEHYLLNDISWREWEAVVGVMYSLFRSWPRFSGNVHFPVGGGCEYMSTENLWIGESGEKHRSMLSHMISELSQ